MSGKKSYDELKFELYYANEQIKEMRKELINNEEYIGKLQKEYDKEIERLKSIIKEVREYIEEKTCELNSCFSDGDWHCTTVKKLLEILDKENKND